MLIITCCKNGIEYDDKNLSGTEVFFTQQKRRFKLKQTFLFCYHYIHKYLFLILYSNRYLSVK